jgi:hypothetical protein
MALDGWECEFDRSSKIILNHYLMAGSLERRVLGKLKANGIALFGWIKCNGGAYFLSEADFLFKSAEVQCLVFFRLIGCHCLLRAFFTLGTMVFVQVFLN